MKITSVNFSTPEISSSHAHEISFFFPFSNEAEEEHIRQDLIDTDNAYYVIFSGDPIITYTVASLTTEESKRLEKLTSAQNVRLVKTTRSSVELNTDFSTLNTNELINYSSEWISSTNPYKILTNKQPCVVGQYTIDRENSTVVSTKYCILDNSSCNINTANKFAIVVKGNATINGTQYTKDVLLDSIVGPVTISSQAKSYVFIIEYTD